MRDRYATKAHGAGDRAATTSPKPRRALLGVVAVLGAAMLTLSGCVSFSDQDQTREAGKFSNNPVPDIIAPQNSRHTGRTQRGPAGPATHRAVRRPRQRGDRHVPRLHRWRASWNSEGKTTYVAERTTGKIIVSKRYGPQRVLATIPVDASGDGGLIDFAFSHLRPGRTDLRADHHRQRQPRRAAGRRRRPQTDPHRNPQGRRRKHGIDVLPGRPPN